MGRYKKGIQGPFSGKIGSVIGSNWRGIDYMKSLPANPVKPPTEKQLNQRYKFAMVNAWLKPIRSLIWIGYQSFTGTKTPMNAAVSLLLKEAVTGTTVFDLALDYKKIILSRGELLSSYITAVTADQDGVLNISWINNPESVFCKADDKATFIFYHVLKEQFVTFQDVMLRVDGKVKLQLPPQFKEEYLHCWMYYTAANGLGVSTSVYIGNILIAC